MKKIHIMNTSEYQKTHAALMRTPEWEAWEKHVWVNIEAGGDD